VIAGALMLLAAAGGEEIDCRDPGNLPQQPMNICAHRDFQRADAEMNVVWKRVAAVMKQSDAELDRSIDRQPLYWPTLLAGQRGWIAWRDSQCMLESFQARGGSMQPMLDSGCRSRLTDDRTRQLKSLIEQ
jgi:uncharacterized protein YecT (DUF1311 family)